MASAGEKERILFLFLDYLTIFRRLIIIVETVRLFPMYKGDLTAMYQDSNANNQHASGNFHSTTKYCSHCGASINQSAVICPHCGCQVEPLYSQTYVQTPVYVPNKYMKDKWVAFVLCLLLGGLGAHKFYEGRILMGVLYLLTGGIFGIGWVVDCIALLFKPNPYFVG